MDSMENVTEADIPSLKKLFADLERESNMYIEKFEADLKELTKIVTAIRDDLSIVNESLLLDLASLINRRLFAIRHFTNNTVFTKLKDNMLVEEIKKLTEVKPELCEEEKTWVTSFANIDTVDEDKDKDTAEEKEEKPVDPEDAKPVTCFELAKNAIPEAGSIVYVVVTHIDRELPTKFNGIYVRCKYARSGRFTNGLELIDYMNSSIAAATYQRLSTSPAVGQYVIASYKADGCYYRAEIKEISKRGTVKVKYIDYGNTAEVSINDLRDLTQELSIVPIQAVPCSLSNVTPEIRAKSSFSDEFYKELQELLLGNMLTCKFIDNKEDVLNVMAYLDHIDVTYYLQRIELDVTGQAKYNNKFTPMTKN